MNPPPGLRHPERFTEAEALLLELCPSHQLAVTAALTGFLSQEVDDDTWRQALVMATDLLEVLS